MNKKEIKEKLDCVHPDGVCYFYRIPISEFSRHQLENFVYLLISSAMSKDEAKIWHDNGFAYLVRKDDG